MIKRFFDWIMIKVYLHSIVPEAIPLFKEGEIWWCSVGENVGTEINGKSDYFTRPVLIFKKFGTESFFGLPLTSQLKSGSWYSSIIVNNNMQTVVLNQGRTYSARRLHIQIEQVSEEYIAKIKADFHRLYLS
jgi:hypothetical protein